MPVLEERCTFPALTDTMTGLSLGEMSPGFSFSCPLRKCRYRSLLALFLMAKIPPMLRHVAHIQNTCPHPAATFPLFLPHPYQFFSYIYLFPKRPHRSQWPRPSRTFMSPLGNPVFPGYSRPNNIGFMSFACQEARLLLLVLVFLMGENITTNNWNATSADSFCELYKHHQGDNGVAWW